MREGSKLDIGYFFHCIVPLSLPFSGLRGTFLCWRRKPGYYISLSIYKFREERGLTKFSYIIFKRVFLLATVSGNQPKKQKQQTLQVIITQPIHHLTTSMKVIMMLVMTLTTRQGLQKRKSLPHLNVDKHNSRLWHGRRQRVLQLLQQRRRVLFATVLWHKLLSNRGAWKRGRQLGGGAGGHLCGEEAAWELLWLRSRGQLAADRLPPRQEPWQADLGPSGSLAPRSCLALSG